MRVTVEDFCREVKNYFVREILLGDFVIENGTIEIDGLKQGQYFRIVGSVLNDGVYQYPVKNLSDEAFDGAIWVMTVPNAVMAFLDEINEYQEYLDANKNIILSPYQSESFGGYSYSKISESASTSSTGADRFTWQEKFRNRLDKYRKVRII